MSGEFTALQRFKEIPDSEQPIAAEEGERIMHIALPIGGETVLMGSDISESMGQKLIEGNNNYVSLHPESKDDALRLYKALSNGGKIEMPFEKAFWGAYFASFTDTFGINWMIHFEEK
ncbi:MAG: hypothetical protein JW795_06945 [Chitinivibrionales bacterium]|nr:hypothetical protein [Chitinivibrionales bacterium]